MWNLLSSKKCETHLKFYFQFSKLLQVAKTSSVITEQDMKDLQNTVAEKVNWVHANKAKIENSIPVVGRLSKSNNE